MGKKQNSKYIFIELLRILAAFLVIVNHTNSDIFLNKGISITWFISLTYFFVSKIAVPIFIIISGYLMLNKCEGYDKHLKRVGRIIVVILLFSLPYYINNVGISEFKITEYLLSIFGEKVTNAYWYVYFYAGVLLMMPFLQKFFQSLEKKDLHVFFLMSAIFYMIRPIIVHYIPELQIADGFDVSLFEVYICLLFVGGYFRKYGFPEIKTILLILIFVLCLVFNVIATFYEYKGNNGWYLFLDNKYFFPIVLQSICTFIVFSRLSIPEKIIPVVSTIGGCTFGIYLLSDLFIEKYRHIFHDLCASGVYCIIAVVIFEIFVFGLGMMVTYILKKVPYIKTII